MGRYHVQFKCHHCGHCCTDVICLPTPWDVLRIAMGTGENPYTFLEFLSSEEITGVEKSDPTWLEVNGERYMMAVQRDETVGCFFLDKQTEFCSIYEQRPLLCRLYPFKLHETRNAEFDSFSLHTDVGCPRNQDGIHETKPLYELYLQDKMHQDDYAALVQAFNKDKNMTRNPDDFLQLFIEIVDADQI
ncbi:MAG: YkgJ family cysteine cluster protein [Candidatus Hydrogenedentes bacterium]|nr:YkgJ family cysteine cluster protein [Candidatus Hydrogenedentota bacterium]